MENVNILLKYERKEKHYKNMKIALYFIFFVGFMTIVTVIDRYSRGPLLTQRDEVNQGSNSIVDANSFLYKKNKIMAGDSGFTSRSTVTSRSQFGGGQLAKAGLSRGRTSITAGSSRGRTSITAGSRRDQTRVTSDTQFKEKEKGEQKTSSQNSVVTAETKFSKNLLTNNRKDAGNQDEVSVNSEVVYKGDEYKVYTLEKGKLVHKENLWFDYLNPPSKKLRQDKFEELWKDKNCCFWKNGKNYETVVDSNLFRRIGGKKIPVK